MRKELIKKIKEEMLDKEKYLSIYATKTKDAIRLKDEVEDIRPAFFHDTDRIIHSMSYTRYINKTQVFTMSKNDNVSKRITHVNQVSKIARTIGRALNLNEDLIEAIALGHDLGHVPFGHVGERILNQISIENNEGYFNHNVESVRLLMKIENHGLGRNLTIQVLDGILCHNGEFVSKRYQPISKNKEIFLQEYNACYKNKDQIKKLIPMTLEGCVVRISDLIAYLGRDLEDAMRLHIITSNDVPDSIQNVLGIKNRDIVNTIVLDIIENSYQKPYIKMSLKIHKAMIELKKFNYQNIYNKANSSMQIKEWENMFYHLFHVYLKHIKNKMNSEIIFTTYLNKMSDDYLNNTSNVRKTLDYMAGMTDNYFLSEYEKYKDA